MISSFLSGIFCCSADSKDDANDKFHQQRSLKLRESENKGENKNLNPKKETDPKKKLQTDTSEDKVPRSDNTRSDMVNSKDKKELLEDDNSVNETDTITNNEDTNVPPENSIKPETLTGEAGHLEPPLDLVVDDNVARGEIPIEDDDALLDLTRLQEGQAYNPNSGWLLDYKDKKFGNRKCLVLDLDETLVHSSFKYLRTADFVIPVEIDNQIHHVYVIKRPGVDKFLKRVGELFEVVVFTASVLKYGDPLLDKLDINKSVHHRLFRDSCYNYQGNFIKNLSQLGRPLSESIIIDNSPASYIFHPQHSIPISSWSSDTHDNELLDLIPFLEDISKPNVDDVSLVLDISI